MTDGLRKRKMDNVDESTEYLNIFEWTITDFMQAFKRTRDGGFLSSPVFVGKCCDLPNSVWHIEVYPKGNDDNSGEQEQFLEVGLALNSDLNEHNPIVKAKYKIHLLDRNQQVISENMGESFEFGPDDCRLTKMATRSELFDVNNNYLDDDMLRVQVKVWIQNYEMRAAECKIQKKLQVQEDLRQLLDSSKFSDVTILVEDLVLKAHKSILSCRSQVFAAMFQNEMTESRTNTIKIEDFSGKTVKGMLEFIYSGKEVVDEDFMELLKIAEKYQLADLKTACTKAAILEMSHENVIELLILGDMYNASELKSSAMTFMNSSKANPMFSQGNENFEKFAEEHPKLLVEMYQNIRNKGVVEVTRFTTKGY